MSGSAAIDLSRLPAPAVIKTVNYEELLAEMKAQAIADVPELEPYLDLESEPAAKILQICAYYRMLDRLEFNDGARANMLAFATGSDLDQLAALFGVERQIIVEANSMVNPPIEEVREDDDRLRARAQLAPESFTTAGPDGAYTFWALSASPSVKDISVGAPRFALHDVSPSLAGQLPENAIVLIVEDDAGLSDPMPGDVAMSVLSTDGDGTPSAELVGEIEAELLPRRPLTDRLRAGAATVHTYTVAATLTLYDGPAAELVQSAAEDAVRAYVQEHHRLGHDITLAGLTAALYQPGVQDVEIMAPAASLEIGPNAAAFCTAISVTVGGTDV